MEHLIYHMDHTIIVEKPIQLQWIEYYLNVDVPAVATNVKMIGSVIMRLASECVDNTAIYSEQCLSLDGSTVQDMIRFCINRPNRPMIQADMAYVYRKFASFLINPVEYDTTTVMCLPVQDAQWCIRYINGLRILIDAIGEFYYETDRAGRYLIHPVSYGSGTMQPIMETMPVGTFSVHFSQSQISQMAITYVTENEARNTARTIIKYEGGVWIPSVEEHTGVYLSIKEFIEQNYLFEALCPDTGMTQDALYHKTSMAPSPVLAQKIKMIWDAEKKEHNAAIAAMKERVLLEANNVALANAVAEATKHAAEESAAEDALISEAVNEAISASTNV